MDARLGTATGLLALSLIVAACTGDDDAADDSTVPSAPTTATTTTTEPPTTVAVTTAPTVAPTTVPPTAPPTTALDIEALKAQVKADVERSWQLRTQLVRNPTLDGLEAALAQITAPGSESEKDLRDFVTQMVQLGQHVEAGVPDYATATVETVEFEADPTARQATAIICLVNNQLRVDSAGVVQPGSGVLIAGRISMIVDQTSNGWLPSSDLTTIDEWPGGTGCPTG